MISKINITVNPACVWCKHRYRNKVVNHLQSKVSSPSKENLSAHFNYFQRENNVRVYNRPYKEMILTLIYIVSTFQ